MLRTRSPIEMEDSSSITTLGAESFDLDWATESLLRHLKVASLEPFGCDRLPLAIRAAGAILDYLSQTQRAATGQLTSLYTYHPDRHMALDPQTRQNLELFEGGTMA